MLDSLPLVVWAVVNRGDGDFEAHQVSESYQNTARWKCMPRDSKPRAYLCVAWSSMGIAGVRQLGVFSAYRIVECEECKKAAEAGAVPA